MGDLVGNLIKIKGGYELHVSVVTRSNDRIERANAYLNAQKIIFKTKKEVKEYCGSRGIIPHNFY